MGWVVNATPRPLYPWERNPVPIVLEAGWAPGPVRRISHPPGFDHRIVQPVVSLYTDWAITAHYLILPYSYAIILVRIRLLFNINAEYYCFRFTVNLTCSRPHSVCCFCDPDTSSCNLCKTVLWLRFGKSEWYISLAVGKSRPIN